MFKLGFLTKKEVDFKIISQLFLVYIFFQKHMFDATLGSIWLAVCTLEQYVCKKQ